jgi:trigger factor
MNITVEKQPSCIGILRVEVPTEDVRSERETIIQGFSKQARIQGFRPGKAPRGVIEKRFATQIQEELEDRLTRKAYDEALKKEDLKVLDFGQPTGISETPSGAITFESKLTLAPDVEIPEYKGLKLQLPPAELSDAELDKQLEQIRQRFADYEDIEERAAEAGDLAVIDYSSTFDGQPLEEALGKSAGYLAGREGFWLKLDEESFLPGFAMELVGSKPGDEKEISVTIPADFPLSDLQGKDVTFAVAVKELKSMKLPELDDEFAAKLQMESIDKLKEVVAEQARAEKKRKIDDLKVNQVVEQLTGQVDFELPEALLQQETQSQADSMVQRGIQSGMGEDEIAAQQQEIFTSAGMQARTSLKTNFILQEIAAAENLVVSDQELVEHLAGMAQSRNEPPKKFIRELQKQGRIPGVRNSLLVGKAIDFVIDQATVEETKADSEAS